MCTPASVKHKETQQCFILFLFNSSRTLWTRHILRFACGDPALQGSKAQAESVRVIAIVGPKQNKKKEKEHPTHVLTSQPGMTLIASDQDGGTEG